MEILWKSVEIIGNPRTPPFGGGHGGGPARNERGAAWLPCLPRSPLGPYRDPAGGPCRGPREGKEVRIKQ